MNVLKPNRQTTIRTLLETNTSQREIERLTGIDRKTIRSYQLRFAAEQANSPGVATGILDQIPPPRPPALVRKTVSACEPHRVFIEAQLRLKRNYMAIYQDLVDSHGFTGAYNSVKRFAGGLCATEPEQFDRLEFAPGEEAQVDYGEGALTRVLGTDRYRKPRLFVMTLRYSRRSFRRVVWKSSQETWARLHEEAWRYFGGASRYVVLDSVPGNRIQLMFPGPLCGHSFHTPFDAAPCSNLYGNITRHSWHGYLPFYFGDCHARRLLCPSRYQ